MGAKAPIIVEMPGFNIRVPDYDVCEVGTPGDYTGPSATRETARNHRYRVEILEPLNRDAGILLYAYKCARPSIEFDVMTIHNGQDEIYRPGKNRWKPIDITFYETCSENIEQTFTSTSSTSGIVTLGASTTVDVTAKLIYQWWSQIMADIAQSRIRRPRDGILKNIDLSMLDGRGKSIWRYHMLHCWPSNITPSELSYADTSIAEITVTIQISKCREVDPNTTSGGGSALPVASTSSLSGSTFGSDPANNTALNPVELGTPGNGEGGFFR